MKLTSSTVLSTLCWSARLTSAATVHVYTFDSEAVEAGRSSGLFSNFVSNVKSQITAEAPRDLSAEEARVVLSQRAGIEDYFGSSAPSSGVLDAINEFGVRTSLFGGQDVQSQLLLVELDEDAELSWEHTSHFTISHAPSFSTAQSFLTKLSDSQPSNGGSLAIVRTTKENLDEQWQDMIKEAVSDPEKRETYTMMVYSPSSMRAEAEAAANSAWSDSKTKARSHSPVEMSSPLRTRQDDSQSSPLRGILPACYASQSQCESATRNCTGHGSCSLSYSDKTYENARPCYSCSCKPTVKDEDGLRSTTYWGGPACQKRNVSSQFWLLALFSVGLVGLISFAVGTLWSMGEETLPSVIGAGVSGPTARR